MICNRPNTEVPSDMQSDAIGEAVRAAGMEYEVLELTHQTMTPENVARQRDLAESCAGPVLAYCASGTRCSVVWALGQCDCMSAEEILDATSKAGYALDGLRPALEQMSKTTHLTCSYCAGSSSSKPSSPANCEISATI